MTITWLRKRNGCRTSADSADSMEVEVSGSDSGSITGAVSSDVTKQPIADAVVTATSPQLVGNQVMVTDASGNYTVPQLPPGTYKLQVSATSYKQTTRKDVKVSSGGTITESFELLPQVFDAAP
jgi:hypothetical protein